MILSTLSTDSRVALIRHWGGSASAAALDPACTIFSLSHIEGLISYRLVNGCAVVCGDPICEPRNIPELATAFQDYCDANGIKVIYIAVSNSFAEWALKNIAKTVIEFGEELFMDPFLDPRDKKGETASLIRRKVRHAIKEGVEVKEYIGDDSAIEAQMEALVQTWLAERKGPQVHISKIRLFEEREGKRWFYAMQKGVMVGLVVLNRIESKQGWHLNHLITLPRPPGGTPEILVITVFERLKAEECHFLTVGWIAKEKLGRMEGLNPVSSWIASTIFQAACKIFHLNSKKKFWEKFFPSESPSFLLFSQKHISMREAMAISKALNVSI